jgi:glucose/arabinose dehydrogenase
VRGTLAVGAVAATAIALLAGCGDGDDPAGTTTAEPSATETAPEDGTGKPRLKKIGDFDQPVFVAQPAGSQDLYVVEQGGTVQRLAPDGQPALALDISADVTSGGEQGLLSIAFAPDVRASRLLYAYYTDRDENQRVAEFRLAEDGSIDAGSRRDVLLMEDFASNHNGGLVLFGPDDLLYIGTGDGGIADDPERNGQNLGSLLGKILRIDPRRSGDRPYTVPADNPFVGEAGARGEVYSYGLRNPWRFSFDRDTQALSIGDVGQNTLEEIDYVTAGGGAGANFGWSAFEGTDRFNEDQEAPGAIPPVLTYGRDRGCSVVGGYVVRDPAVPALAGRYVYGDYCEGELRSFMPAESGARDDGPLGLEVDALSSFGEDNQGRVYATSLDGPVLRLVQ